jgi:ABC-type Fe2+-enterobactin transport system substrate-binding protein
MVRVFNSWTQNSTSSNKRRVSTGGILTGPIIAIDAAVLKADMFSQRIALCGVCKGKGSRGALTDARIPVFPSHTAMIPVQYLGAQNSTSSNKRRVSTGGILTGPIIAIDAAMILADMCC